MRLHVLGIPHTITTAEYSSCAFTQKVHKLCEMMKAQGHTVIHYGNLLSKVPCDENVAVTLPADLEKSYGKWNWRELGWPRFSREDEVYKQFYRRTIRAIGRRKQPGDFLLCSFGDWHRPVAEAHPDLIAIESGIGYPNGTFARFKIYESYAIMHGYQGNKAAISASNDFWYDAVIPNAFRPQEFTYRHRDEKDDFLLFLGRVNPGKGVHVAKDIAARTGKRLVIAGPGVQEENTDKITYVGNVGPEQRADLLSRAQATICASTFMEPFCGVQVESFLSGTPVISTDWGAFAEYNRHHETGYRCKTMEQFVWAANNIDRIDSLDCLHWGMQFTLDKVAPRYTEYLRSLQDIYNGSGGWYAERPDRKDLMQSSNCAFSVAAV